MLHEGLPDRIPAVVPPREDIEDSLTHEQVAEIRKDLLQRKLVAEFKFPQAVEPVEPPVGSNDIVRTSLRFLQESLNRPIVVNTDEVMAMEPKERLGWRTKFNTENGERAIYESDALRWPLVLSALEQAEELITRGSPKLQDELLATCEELRAQVYEGWGRNEKYGGGLSLEDKEKFVFKTLNPFLRRVRDAFVSGEEK